MYLTYDIKGIQQFIFSVPRLKCIIGASSQVARFDHETVAQIANRDGCGHVFSGGGRGAIRCQSRDLADDIKRELVQAAHQLGLDIRIGIDRQFTVAALHADELYPFLPVPQDMEGLPCAESGLWPVPGSDGTKVHPLIEQRIAAGKPGKDALLNYLFGSDLIGSRTPTAIKEAGTIEFLRNVNPEEVRGTLDEKAIDQWRATAGQNALGRRNRWAVIAMDVNDMGQQFDALEQQAGDEETYVSRLGIVSKSIKEITHQAFANALVSAMQQWLNDVKPNLQDCCYEEEPGCKYVFLPFRPLVLGGDDVVFLCHSELAMHFVHTMAREFTELSVRKAKEIQEDRQHGGFNPWPATGGKLSISAGVLFTKVTLPLHTAVAYAESLLDNAKNEFREPVETGLPTPSAVDWETITDTMVDTPAARRNREMRFVDEEINAAVHLTRRPYLLDVEPSEKDNGKKVRSLQSLEKRVAQLGAFPASFRSELKHACGKEWSERTRFCISMGKGGKRYRALSESLAEPADGVAASKGNAWFVPMEEDESGVLKPQMDGGKQLQTTDVVDAISLLEEQHRMMQETAQR